MLPGNKKDHLRIIRTCIHYLNCVDIYGEEAPDVAECIKFLQQWLELTEATPATMAKFKRKGGVRANKVNKKRS